MNSIYYMIYPSPDTTFLLYSQGSESEEELEDLPRFRTRLSACGPRAKESARAGRAIRSGTLSGDEIEILRNGHEQDRGYVKGQNICKTIWSPNYLRCRKTFNLNTF